MSGMEKYIIAVILFLTLANQVYAGDLSDDTLANQAIMQNQDAILNNQVVIADNTVSQLDKIQDDLSVIKGDVKDLVNNKENDLPFQEYEKESPETVIYADESNWYCLHAQLNNMSEQINESNINLTTRIDILALVFCVISGIFFGYVVIKDFLKNV